MLEKEEQPIPGRRGSVERTTTPFSEMSTTELLEIAIGAAVPVTAPDRTIVSSESSMVTELPDEVHERGAVVRPEM
jgi:hypothetical protein